MKSSKLAAAMALAGLALGVATSAQAGVVWYTDRTAWETAAGTLSFTENFSGFRTDQSFRTAPVALNGMTIQQQGSSDFRNEVDVSPFQFSDNSGSSYASMYTNFGATTIAITFAADNAAFGGESWLGSVLEGAALEIFDGAALLGSHVLGAGNGAFLGYVLDGGDSATSVRFTSVNNTPGAGGEGFGYDNLAGRNASTTNVPVPGTAALLALGLGALTSVRRRK